MQQLSLAAGRSQQFTRDGEMLHVVNDPLLALARAGEGSVSLIARIHGAYLLIGFDHVPSVDMFEGVVPPFSEVCLAVPDTVKSVYLAVGGAVSGGLNDGTHPFYYPLGTGAGPFLVEWLPCVVSPFHRGIIHGALAGHGAFNANIIPSDLKGNMVQPIPATSVYDQQISSALFPPFFRPKLAVSQVDTIHQVTVLNTLFPFSGPNTVLFASAADASNGTRFQVLFRVKVSVSAACMFVLGTPSLAVNVAAPDIHERGRLVFAGAGTQDLEFGEGIAIGQEAAGGTWQAFTTAPVTLDATVIGG